MSQRLTAYIGLAPALPAALIFYMSLDEHIKNAVFFVVR